MEQSVARGKFVARIKQKYSERRLNREKQWPPCKSDKLVRLELVEGELRQGYSAGQTRGRDDKAVKRSPLAYSDILKAKDGKKTVRKVLVEGDAGIGKTTLCIAVSEDWANEKLFTEFEMVLLLSLRQKRIASADSLLDLLKLLHPSQKICELVAEYVEEEEGKVLIIADGWDELSVEDRSEGSFLYELLFGECYSLSVIVTSRPSASAQLRKLPCIDRLVECQGFSKANIKEFIQCEFAFESGKGSDLLEQLEGNPLIESVCSVPLNCAIVCHLWHHLKGALPTTMSQLYTKIVLNILFRDIANRPGILSLSHFDALPEALQQPWSLLCVIAFQTLSEDKIIFSHDDLSRSFQGLSLSEEVHRFGLLQSAESILVDGHGVSFHFLHLTFQEYLAALYLVKRPPDDQLQLCRLYSRSERFKMVWRFFFGICFTVCNQPVDLDVSKVLVDANFDPFKALNPCHFAFEANHRSMDILVVSKIKDSSFIMFNTHTAFDLTAAIHVIANLHDCSGIHIDLSSCGFGDKQIAALAAALAGEHKKLQVSRLDLSGNKLTDESVADLFDRASPAFSQSLQEIQLQNNMIGPKAINSITTVLAKSLPVSANRLSSSTLNISDNPLEVEGLEALRDAMCANKLANLTWIDLAGSLTSDAHINAEFILALGSGHCPSLSRLYLSRNNLGVPGGKALGKVLPHLHSGVSLHLEETMLGDEGISALTQNLEGTCKLKSLYLKSNDIHAAGILCLAESICASNISIRGGTFDLNDNPLGLEGVMAVIGILSSGHISAFQIDLSGCQLTTAGGSVTNPDFVNAIDVQQLICSQRLQASDVKFLYIDKNNFTGEGIHILAAFVYACPSLFDLYCQSCGITSDDLKQLLIQLSKLKLEFSYLRLWYLSNNDIDDDGISDLIQHWSMFPKLKSIYLDSNIQVSPEMLKTLEEKLAPQRVHLWDNDNYLTGSVPSVESSDKGTESEDYGEQGSHMEDSDRETSAHSGDSSSDKELTETEDYGEDTNTSPDMEDSDMCSTEEAGTMAATLRDMGVREATQRLSNVEESPLSNRVRTMEDERVEQLQPTLDSEETTTAEAEGESQSKQEVVHLSTSSAISAQVQRLNKVLDAEHNGVSKHLGQIADAMYEWEGPIAEQLELTSADVAGIKTEYPNKLRLQTRAALQKWKLKLGPNATYNNLIKVFERVGYKHLADFITNIAEAESESLSKQEVVHLSTGSATSTQVQRLNKVLDAEHDEVPKHLGQIAGAMTLHEWEGPIAEQLELTRADIAEIKTMHPAKLRLQMRAALEKWKQKLGPHATYNNLIKAFEKAGYKDLADSVRYSRF